MISSYPKNGNERRIGTFIKGCGFLFVSITVGSILDSALAFARELPAIKVTAGPMDMALRDALLDGDQEKFDRLIANGADPTEWLDDSPNGWTFCAATERGKDEYLKSIIHFGFNVNHRQTNIVNVLSTPLGCAVMYGNETAMKVLVGAGANPALGQTCETCKGFERSSILAEAVRLSEFSMAAWLLEHGEYSPEQLDSIIYNLESFPLIKSSPKYMDLQKLVDKLSSMGLEVNPWNSENTTK